MIALALPAEAERGPAFVAKLNCASGKASEETLSLVSETSSASAFAGSRGLVAIEHPEGVNLDGDVVLVDPSSNRVERLIRRGSRHNTLLVTERCDQLCVMCSQPPKKTHDDRFQLLEGACLLADQDAVIGITGGEPTLYKQQLLTMVENVLAARPDIAFHVLTNGQHFDPEDAERLADDDYRRVQWGIPLYSDNPSSHDAIVGKIGAFDRLENSLATLACAGASIELRTVVLTENVEHLPTLARYIARRLPFIGNWSIMQLENIGFARNRWSSLRFDHAADFSAIGAAIDVAALYGLQTQLFNFPRCTVPVEYRDYAVASISDWKQRFASACSGCREKSKCSGFFEWHPVDEIDTKVTPL